MKTDEQLVLSEHIVLKIESIVKNYLPPVSPESDDEYEIRPVVREAMIRPRTALFLVKGTPLKAKSHIKHVPAKQPFHCRR